MEQAKGDWYQSFVVEFEFYSGSVVQVWVVCVESSVGGLGRIVIQAVFGYMASGCRSSCK